MEFNMSKIPQIIPTGGMFIFSIDSHSNYSVYGIFRALKDINPEKVLEDYLEAQARNFSALAFFHECHEKGLFEKVPGYEWNVDNAVGIANQSSLSEFTP
jgi:hypothetical protein